MKIKMFGKVVPAWLLLGGLIVAASGAGVGTILAGNVSGEMPVTVSQALLINACGFPDTDVLWSDNFGTVQGVTRETLVDHHDKPDRSICVVSDDHTNFEAAAEIDQGDKFLLQVCLSNMSHQDAITRFDLNIPDGIEVEIFGSDEDSQRSVATGRNINDVISVTRIGPRSWKFIVVGGARSKGLVPQREADLVGDITPWQDCIGIQIKSDDTNPPGYYTIDGFLRQIAS